MLVWTKGASLSTPKLSIFGVDEKVAAFFGSPDFQHILAKLLFVSFEANLVIYQK